MALAPTPISKNEAALVPAFVDCWPCNGQAMLNRMMMAKQFEIRPVEGRKIAREIVRNKLFDNRKTSHLFANITRINVEKIDAIGRFEAVLGK